MSATTEATLPSPPFITVQGIPNFRDLGGYPTVSPSHSVKRSIIYRCGEPSRVTPDGIKTMQNLGISHIYDLRSGAELQRNRDAGRGDVVEWEGCERVFVPVFKDEQDYSPEGLAVRLRDYASKDTEGYVRAYTDILNAAPESYRTILLHLANEPEKPLIVHCTAGKDRTGVICALILSLCGVEDEIVAQEYALTDVGLTEEWKRAAIKHLAHIPEFQADPEGMRRLIGARASSMTAALQTIKKNFGGAEGYMMDKCGLTKEEVEKIKSNLIVKTPAINSTAQ